MDWRTHIARYGEGLLPGAPWARIALVATLLLASILRFWNLPALPYTHDELSALTRLYPSLTETIATGVRDLDTHPPAVQAFEWLWTRLFSLREADVKLPFIVMSIMAIALLYRFALAWTGEGAAIVLAVLMATLQYSIFYGQLARPYAAGLLTTALMADQLTRWLAFGKRRTLIGTGIAAALSAATHHFSLLLAAIMAITGLLLTRPEQRKAYLFMCAAACAAYLPIVPITLHQLGQGGLQGWLPPPGQGWLADYASYIAHHSTGLSILLILLLGASLLLVLRAGAAPRPAPWMLLIWGALPLIIGYAYSVWRAPVLQYSLVLFSFPYLALFALQGLRHLRRHAALACAAVLACTAVHTLVHERKHYVIAYHSKYEAIVHEAIRITKEQGRDQVLVLFDAPWHMIDFYRRHWGVPEHELNAINVQGMPQARIDSTLVAHAGGTVLLGRSNGAEDEHMTLVQERFPRLSHRTDLAEGQVLVFSKQPVAMERFDRDTIAHLDIRQQLGPWQIGGDLPRSAAGWDYSNREFGLLIELMLDSVVIRRDDIVELIAQVDGFTDSTRAALVADVRRGEEGVFYRTGDLKAPSRPSGPASMVVAVSPDYLKAGDQPLLLRAYVHNQNRGTLQVNSITILRRDANPVRDAFLAPVPWLGRFPPE